MIFTDLSKYSNAFEVLFECYALTNVQDSKFPKDTGINPRLAEVKEQKNTRNYRITLTIPAHSLAVSRFTACLTAFFVKLLFQICECFVGHLLFINVIISVSTRQLALFSVQSHASLLAYQALKRLQMSYW